MLVSTSVGWLVLYPGHISIVQELCDVLVAVLIFLRFSLLSQYFLKGVSWNPDARGFVKYLQKLGHFVL